MGRCYRLRTNGIHRGARGWYTLPGKRLLFREVEFKVGYGCGTQGDRALQSACHVTAVRNLPLLAPAVWIVVTAVALMVARWLVPQATAGLLHGLASICEQRCQR